MKWKYRAHLIGVMGKTGFGCPPLEGRVRALTLDGAIAAAFRAAAIKLRPNIGESILIESVER